MQAPARAGMSEQGLVALSTETGEVTANYDSCGERVLASAIKSRFAQMVDRCTLNDTAKLSAAQEAFQNAYSARLEVYSQSGATCAADFQAWHQTVLNILDEASGTC